MPHETEHSDVFERHQKEQRVIMVHPDSSSEPSGRLTIVSNMGPSFQLLIAGRNPDERRPEIRGSPGFAELLYPFVIRKLVKQSFSCIECLSKTTSLKTLRNAIGHHCQPN